MTTPRRETKHYARGEAHGMAKLTAEKATAIRGMHADGIPLAELAMMHGVTERCIWSIVNRRTWRHVP